MRIGLLVAMVMLCPVALHGQRGCMGGGGMGGMGGMGGGFGEPRFSAPVLPGPELDGPPDTTEARKILVLSDDQTRKYGQAHDSFMVATRPQRDSIHAQLDLMTDKLTGGDRAAATFYAERATKISHGLRDIQIKWEE